MQRRELPDIHEPRVPPLSEREIRSTLERLWLTYYNNELFKAGAISRDEYNQMQAKILARTGKRKR